MTRTLRTNRVSEVPSQKRDVSPANLGPELREVLATLADINARHKQEVTALESWHGPSLLKEHFARDLAERHRKDREPYVLRLAELHHQTLTARLFQGTVH